MPYSTTQWEREVIAGETGYDLFLATFGKEIEELATWINRAPEQVDVEAVYETMIDEMEFDHTELELGTNWNWVRDTFEDWSPRLRAARIAREAA